MDSSLFQFRVANYAILPLTVGGEKKWQTNELHFYDTSFNKFESKINGSNIEQFSWYLLKQRNGKSFVKFGKNEQKHLEWLHHVTPCWISSIFPLASYQRWRYQTPTKFVQFQNKYIQNGIAKWRLSVIYWNVKKSGFHWQPVVPVLLRYKSRRVTWLT